MSNMEAILKFKMPATKGRFRVGSQSKNEPTGAHYKCAKFHNIFRLSRWTISRAVFEITGHKDIRDTTLTFQGHVTSSMTSSFVPT